MKKLLLIIFILLESCQTTGKIIDVLKNPNINLGSNLEQPSKINLNFLADKCINFVMVKKNEESDEEVCSPKSVVFSFFYLKDKANFLLTSNEEIISNDWEKVVKFLGKNYIDHQEYLVEPDEFNSIINLEAPSKTAYVGVMAKFANLGESKWRDIIKVKDKAYLYNILLDFKGNSVRIRALEE